MNICVGAKDKQIKEDRYRRDVLYYSIKGWADPKQFTVTKERFWYIEGDERSQVIMPTRDELLMFDQRFRSIGSKKKWLE